MDIRERFQNVNAIIHDTHVVYTSGLHGSAYVAKDALYPHTLHTSAVCKELAAKFKDDNIEAVVAPAIGGIILSQWTAYYLSAYTGKEVFGVYADKEGSGFVMRRGYDKLIENKNILVVEDVLNTGGTVRRTIAAVHAVGGRVFNVGVLCNRSSLAAADFNLDKLEALMTIKLDAWREEDCPLCLSGVPINTSVGKGIEFLARREAELEI